MSADKNPQPKCCSECIHFKRSLPYAWGKCTVDLPWWIEWHDTTIHPPERKAEECDCFTIKP